MELVEFTSSMLPEGLGKCFSFHCFGADQIAKFSYPSLGFIWNSCAFARKRINCTLCLEIATEYANQRSTSSQHRQKQRIGEDSIDL